ncbi:MAG: hypothetical protein D9V47_13805 [Clostridia bacterium]|nr:MAG: hypothetical protein D9V47_13805 [Clostridia bacterium]
MLERQILTTIGQKLLERGKCPYDPACLYGSGDRCAAPKEVWEEKAMAIAKDISREPGHIGVPNLMWPGPWPCDDVVAVVFDLPRPPEDELFREGRR